MHGRAALLVLALATTASRAEAQGSPHSPPPAGGSGTPGQVPADAPAPPADAPAPPGATTAPDTAAPPGDASTTQARDVFRLGSTLARQGQWLDALAAFERSAELYPHPVTTYNLGYVERALGHLTRAGKYMQLALEPGTSGQTLPEDLVALARGYLVEINRKVARAVVLAESTDLSITIDGRPLEVVPSAAERPTLVAGTLPAGPPQRVPATTFELLIDPGNHVILVSVPGKQDAVVTRVFAQGSTDTIRLPEREAAPLPAPPVADKTPEPEREASEGTDLTPWMWTAFGVGAAGIITGTVFGALALDKDATLDDACQGDRENCPEGSQGDIQDLELYAPVSDIAFIVGGVGIGTGAVLWFMNDPGSTEQGATLRVQGGSGAARVSLSGRF